MNIERVSVPNINGVHAVAYAMNLTVSSSSSHVSIRGENVLFGAGRMELALNLGGSPSSVFPISLGNALILDVERRMAKVASGTP